VHQGLDADEGISLDRPVESLSKCLRVEDARYVIAVGLLIFDDIGQGLIDLRRLAECDHLHVEILSKKAPNHLGSEQSVARKRRGENCDSRE
jgi:hypothetical protein